MFTSWFSSAGDERGARLTNATCETASVGPIADAVRKHDRRFELQKFIVDEMWKEVDDLKGVLLDVHFAPTAAADCEPQLTPWFRLDWVSKRTQEMQQTVHQQTPREYPGSQSHQNEYLQKLMLDLINLDSELIACQHEVKRLQAVVPMDKDEFGSEWWSWLSFDLSMLNFHESARSCCGSSKRQEVSIERHRVAFPSNSGALHHGRGTTLSDGKVLIPIPMPNITTPELNKARIVIGTSPRLGSSVSSGDAGATPTPRWLSVIPKLSLEEVATLREEGSPGLTLRRKILLEQEPNWATSASGQVMRQTSAGSSSVTSSITLRSKDAEDRKSVV